MYSTTAISSAMNRMSRLCFLSLLLVSLLSATLHIKAQYYHEVRNEYGQVMWTIYGDSQLDLDVQVKSWFYVRQSVVESLSYTHLSTPHLSDEEIHTYIGNIQDVAHKHGFDDRAIYKTSSTRL